MFIYDIDITYYMMIRSFVVLFLVFILLYSCIGRREGQERFVSGQEGLLRTYECRYPLSDPKFATPQQKEFQTVLTEHSALDPNLQRRRVETKTQLCKVGDHCFNSEDFHDTTHLKKFESSPDIINTRIGFEPKPAPVLKFIEHQDNYVVPANSASYEKPADLFDENILPDLFFVKKYVKRGENDPGVNEYNTAIY
jgi:hypothetical protein